MTGQARPPVVRRAGWPDLPGVYRLHSLCFPHRYSRWRFVGYQLSPRGAILVVDGEDGLSGYVVATLSTLLRPPAVTGEVISLAVAPSQRRRGIGRALLEAACAETVRWGMSEVYLQVAVDNEPALALYRQAGFETVERLRHYYVGGGDAWLMRRGNAPPDEIAAADSSP